MCDDVKTARFRYGRFLAEGARASACVACRACEPKCPQQIPISEWMPKAAAVLGEAAK
jgi:predicted aldo/keto reductase-like oxidoreductase